MREQNAGPWRWAEALLERLLPESARETIVGDLREEFVEAIDTCCENRLETRHEPANTMQATRASETASHLLLHMRCLRQLC